MLRGLALCGILVPNFLTVAGLGSATDATPPTTLANPSGWIELPGDRAGRPATCSLA